jgi:hypothetical protein
VSPRSRHLFDRYVAEYLKHPHLASLSLESHAYNLVSLAHAQGISVGELTEEVGPLREALATAKRSEDDAP